MDKKKVFGHLGLGAAIVLALIGGTFLRGCKAQRQCTELNTLQWRCG